MISVAGVGVVPGGHVLHAAPAVPIADWRDPATWEKEHAVQQRAQAAASHRQGVYVSAPLPGHPVKPTAPSKVSKSPAVVPEQWYTGSLASPSPALPEAGLWGVEPYVGGMAPHGEFDPRGHYTNKKGDGPNGFQQFTLTEYSVTNHVTLYVLPSYTYTWGNGTHHSSGLQINDFPMEVKYRIGPNYSPSLTISIGANAPVGRYSNLHNAQEGVGTGAWIARFGVETQLVFPFFNHQQRIRGWAMEREPFTSTSIRNASVYNGMSNPFNGGSWKGFRGTGHPGAFGNEGVSWEGGLTRGWLLALDLYHTWSAGTQYGGRFTGDMARLRSLGLPTGHVHSHKTPWSGAFRVAPAIEYNWSGSWGAIAGCDIPVVGHNTSAALTPEAAVFYVF
ncbi:hypothetical protein [Oecophyllibacter saccharovorans]|uniref:hypothetical protein n=1 Tax=Oecophyllibacter saccharovorans TaxID=2558360 RepID=UPI00116B8054|nr:hypothetical protein [Oecophyllibacter saccharovorans]TPW33746.1 hypothetical protein E3203_08090 [Oecophyllibacter saccharovorans]